MSSHNDRTQPNHTLSNNRLQRTAFRKAHPAAKQGQIWDAIRENGLKNNSDYGVYNFRNKSQEDDYKASGKIPKATPSIYNRNAVDFIVKVLNA